METKAVDDKGSAAVVWCDREHEPAFMFMLTGTMQEIKRSLDRLRGEGWIIDDIWLCPSHAKEYRKEMRAKNRDQRKLTLQL